MARFSIGPGSAGGRVDQVVASLMPGVSVAGTRRLIAAGAVRVDGRLARKGDRVSAGQTIDVDDAGAAGQTTPGRRVLPDPSAPLEVLATDADFVAIAKPPGLPTHPLKAGETGTAANALVARFPECAAASPNPREGGLVHRLDTGTSGVLLAARSAEAWTAMRGALADARCEKLYLAEVHGVAQAGQSLEPIGRAGRGGPGSGWVAAAIPCRPTPPGSCWKRAPRPAWCARGCRRGARTRSARTWPPPATRSSAIPCTAAIKTSSRFAFTPGRCASLTRGRGK